MFFNNLLKSGWLHALFIAVIAYPFASMTQKLVSSYSDVNILAYTGVFMLFSAITLLFMAGPGELANETIKRFETWLYSILQITSYILFLYSLKYATATQGAALAMVGIVFIFIFSIAFLRQKTNIYEVIGIIIMIIGFIMVIYTSDIDNNAKAILTLLIVTRGLVFSFQKIITEVHKTNRKAVSFKSQMRVTGFIMAIASFIYLVFLLSIATLKQSVDIELFSKFPNYADFANLDMVLFSLFVGGFVVSTTKYCEFFAGKSIGAKYLTPITSLQIVFVYFLELVLSKYEIIEKSTVDYSVIGALVLILLGNFIISVAGFIKDLKFIKKGEKQDTLANIDENFIENETDFKTLKLSLSNLLSLYDNNVKKLSEDLGIEKVMLDNIMHYDYTELRVKNKIAHKINSFASHNVSIKDKLTKAYNRYYLDHISADLFKQDVNFKIYYLDLNNFKPVNDNYGHDAGDYALTETVNRLQNIEYFKDNVFRLGGDEFILIQLDNHEKDLTPLIIKTIEQPISFKDYVFEISSSVGCVISEKYEDLNSMLEHADNLMFSDKKEK